MPKTKPSVKKLEVLRDEKSFADSGKINQLFVPAIVFLIFVFFTATPSRGEVPNSLVVDWSNSNGAVTGEATPLTQHDDYAETEITITNPYAFWTKILVPPESDSYELTPDPFSIYSHIGYLAPNASARYRLRFYNQYLVSIGVGATLEHGWGAHALTVLQTLVYAAGGGLLNIESVQHLDEVLTAIYKVELLVEATNRLGAWDFVGASFKIAKICLAENSVKLQIVQLLSKVGINITIETLKTFFTAVKIYKILKQMIHQIYAFVLADATGYIYFRPALLEPDDDPEPYILCGFSANPDSAAANSPIQFDAGSSQAYNDMIVSYEWDFRDGTVVGSDSSVIEHAYSTDGCRYPLLTIRSDSGLEKTVVLIM